MVDSVTESEPDNPVCRTGSPGEADKRRQTGLSASPVERVLTAAGFHQHNGTLVAYFGNYGPNKETTRLQAVTTTDGEHWSAPRARGETGRRAARESPRGDDGLGLDAPLPVGRAVADMLRLIK
jgi:hypothetical protein